MSTKTLKTNIEYAIGDTPNDRRRRKWYPSCMKPNPPKRVLRHVLGIFKPGMNTLMGENLQSNSI